MLTSLFVTLALAVFLTLVLLLLPALLVQRFVAGPADDGEDWVDLFPKSAPMRLGVDAARRVGA